MGVKTTTTKTVRNPLRELAGENQFSTLARSLGITRSHVCRIMNGSREPSLGVAKRMAKALGVSLDKLAVMLEKRVTN